MNRDKGSSDRRRIGRRLGGWLCGVGEEFLRVGDEDWDVGRDVGCDVHRASVFVMWDIFTFVGAHLNSNKGPFKLPGSGGVS